MKATALKFIGQDDTGDTPAFEFAAKGQELLVIEKLTDEHWGWKQNYRYVCQDVNKRYGTFYVEKSEIKIEDKKDG